MVARDLLAVTQEDGLPTTGHNEQPAILQPIAFQVALNAIPPSLRGREGEREATVAQLTARRVGFTRLLTLEMVRRVMAEIRAAQMLTKLNRL